MKKKYFFCAFLLFVQIYLDMAQPKVVFKIHVTASKNGRAEGLDLATALTIRTLQMHH
ncbi:hypothetical protein [Mucilaginibacter polytrichastri]|uniref:hypothetical protein n=1 Tax=Mucilaginibacter polytrichastri TaxID=1302689 RepID=UPI0008F41A1B|nr:hypothetical protein [Mucilaginibacter polytrichastri]SFS37390.1 hypothetical protein SAMN04487890_101136 [Mucilaginibacter polytrichastri]